MSVLLKKPVFKGISQQELAQQIEGRKKCQKKLPTWFETPGIYFPKKVNIEQTSSEISAEYKSNIVNGDSLVDVTGGFGIDSYYFSKKVGAIFHCEIDQELHEIASHNLKSLGIKNIQTYQENGLDFLRNSVQDFDWIYLDPSRRNQIKGKVFQLSDCEPNIVENLDLLFSKSENILLKTSPLLDITMGIKQLHSIKEVHIVAINNDVKELLWVLKKDYFGEVGIKTINFTKSDSQLFNFVLSTEKIAAAVYSLPLCYIYEPNAAILKSGAFKCLGLQFGLKKLHPNTHLYTSEEPLDFPGRRFEIAKVVSYNKKGMKALGLKKANISIRNFPDTVVTIRKKFKIEPGGNSFLFFFKNCANRYQVALCYKA
ncbi:MAG: class I SAM-dependent methyltransferase [Maribacter sp.]|uniref:THUMP-like domain-containing protein n=1 Tax=Maribacter sp. TaxID=1897614 RepID=UPI0032971FDC